MGQWVGHLDCPVCDNSAYLVGRGLDAESRGFSRMGKVRRFPVFRCRRCKSMLIVKVPRFGSSVKARAVDLETGERMREAYGNEMRRIAKRRDQIAPEDQ